LDSNGIDAYESRGITILCGEWEEFIAALFFRAVESGENALKLNFRIIELWCDKMELDTLDVHDALNSMLCAANAEQIKKIEQESKKIRARGKKR
jgi:hypothetical protein